jgi:hypothetical protein
MKRPSETIILELTRKLAEAKARKVASECPDAVVVSEDAVVSKGARIYEKPRDKDEAAQFLRELSGSEFQFVTALAVIHSQTGNMLSTVEVSNISFRQLVQCEIQAYISKYDVLPYAGAFESDAVLRDRTTCQPTDRVSSSARHRYLNAKVYTNCVPSSPKQARCVIRTHRALANKIHFA